MVTRAISRQGGTHRRRGFTLIELLAVIAIIGLLVGLSFTMVNRMRNQARRARAASEASQIATAWMAYVEDHRAWPQAYAGSDIVREMDATAIRILRGNDEQNNPQSRTYLDFRGTTTEYLDPWGNRYRFRLDVNWNNRVTDPRGGDDVWVPVLVWSLGPSGEERDDDIIASTN